MWSKKYSDTHHQPLKEVLSPFLVYIQVIAKSCFMQRKIKQIYHWIHSGSMVLAEIQKAASMASVLVLNFSPAVLIFEHPAQIVVH